jgi:uncharacterized protein YkwD
MAKIKNIGINWLMRDYCLMGLLICHFCLASFTLADTQIQTLAKLEKQVLGAEYAQETKAQRLSRLENSVFGKTNTNLNDDQRLQKLEKTLRVVSKPVPTEFTENIAKEQAAQEQTQTNQVAHTKLQIQPNLQETADLMLKIINQERSFRSLAPLRYSKTANQVALEHASYLVQTKQFSHYGVAGHNPDQRYTLAGGEGRVEEIVDGFFAQVDEQAQIIPITVNQETPNHLMDAILKVPDKMDILFNQDANTAGISFVLSPDRKQLAVVVEIVADYVSLGALPHQTSAGEVYLDGSVQNNSYKFAWIGIAKKDDEVNAEMVEVEPSPYFPPIDKVIYVDKTVDRAKAIAKTGGLILAMVAAPFTYGASILVADILMQSLAQAYQAQDVEVREGIKAKSNSFSGQISLGEWGPGLYYVSIWSFPQGSKKAVIISRQTVQVG